VTLAALQKVSPVDVMATRRIGPPELPLHVVAFARAIGAWPLAAGFGVLQLLALARRGEAVDWEQVEAWIYVGGVVGTLGLGPAGVVAVRRVRHADAST
jgi:hypothetical protein